MTRTLCVGLFSLQCNLTFGPGFICLNIFSKGERFMPKGHFVGNVDEVTLNMHGASRL